MLFGTAVLCLQSERTESNLDPEVDYRLGFSGDLSGNVDIEA
jgi:hypothetical protein